MFSPAWVPFSPVIKQLKNFEPDLVHLHWVQKGMLSIKDWKKLPGPIVWTLHDMWAFTGGDHYDCEQRCYTRQCGHCTNLGSSREHDLSHRIWKQKKAAWKNVPLTIVTPSHWLGEQVRQSSLLGERPLHIIPNGLDTEFYRPLPKAQARSLLNLEAERPWILLSGLDLNEDPRKGFDLLTEMLQFLASKHSRLGVLIAGASWSPRQLPAGLDYKFLGKLEDELSLVLAYNAADVVVLPSRQENFSNAMVEAMACGVPVAGFDIGGNPDMIVPGETGVLAPPFDTKALAGEVDKLLSHPEALRRLSSQARERAVAMCSLPKVAQRYHEVFAAVEDSYVPGQLQKFSRVTPGTSRHSELFSEAAPDSSTGVSALGTRDCPQTSCPELTKSEHSLHSNSTQHSN